MSRRILTGLIAPFAIALTFSFAADVTAQQAQPRDPRSDVPRPASARELALQSAIASDPANVANWLELAKLQEARGATIEAEDALKSALAQSGNARNVLSAIAQFYGRTGQFDKAVAALEDAAAQDPNDPAGHQLVAIYYWEKAQKDTALNPDEKLRYIESGINATDKALAINGNYVEALTYKNILLRMKANLAQEPAQRDALTAEADALRNRAIELQKATRAAAGTVVQEEMKIAGQAPVRVGGNIKTPTKIQDVRPVYPPEAMANGVAGMVILEVLIDTEGNVESAKVLRSIPVLDQAALDAVKQWRFTPTLLNGVPVPVLMTVTVNFTLQLSPSSADR